MICKQGYVICETRTKRNSKLNPEYVKYVLRLYASLWCVPFAFALAGIRFLASMMHGIREKEECTLPAVPPRLPLLPAQLPAVPVGLPPVPAPSLAALHGRQPAVQHAKKYDMWCTLLTLPLLI